MRKVINGKNYDTENSILIAAKNTENNERWLELYRTQDGEFFLVRWPKRIGDVVFCLLLSKEEAKEWYEILSVQKFSHQEAFEEERKED